MPVFNTIVVPELEFYFARFVKGTTLNKDEIPFPVQLNRDDLYQDKSFIRLLFDDDWPSSLTDYFIYFQPKKDRGNWPQVVIDRSMLYASSAQYYIACDSTAEVAINLFNLTSVDILLLDQLLQYRLNPSSYTLTISFSLCTTNLSKMIWLFLDLKVNEDFGLFDNTVPISDPSITIENMYETYLTETVFDYVDQRNAKGI